MAYIVAFLKKYIDRLYYRRYNLGSKETLIRQMFPGIAAVGEYRKLEKFLKNISTSELDNMNKALMSFYWGEVERLTTEGNFRKIERYQGLVDFVQSIRDYSDELISLNIKQ